jgi:DNA-directed RNA polymerase subunit M/transcription elongation factor TFIIS
MDECPKCGKWIFAEYIDELHIKKCPNCGYRERVIFTDNEDRLKRLIKLHLKELEEMEKKEKYFESEAI